jgi:AsmA protein
LKARGTLRAGEFKFAKMKASKLAVGIVADQSTLSIDPINANLYGGSLSGSFRISAQEPAKFELKQKLAAIQINSLLHDISGESKFNGKGNITLDLSTEGNSIGAMHKALGGTVTLALTRGSIGGINLAAALADGKNQLGMQDAERSHSAKFNEQTDFSELKINFDIANGVARSNEVTLKSPLFTCKGEGELNLDSGNLEYRLDTSIAPALKRQINGELADMKGIGVPGRVNGHYATPTFTFNFGTASGGNSAKLIKANMAKAASTNKIAADKPASH